MNNVVLKPCPFCGGEACVKTSTTQTIPSHPMAWVYCKKCKSSSASFDDYKKTALFCLMQSMHGTAVPERRASMSNLIYRLEMEANEE